MKDLDTIIQPFLPALLPVLVRVSIPRERSIQGAVRGAQVIISHTVGKLFSQRRWSRWKFHKLDFRRSSRFSPSQLCSVRTGNRTEEPDAEHRR